MGRGQGKKGKFVEKNKIRCIIVSKNMANNGGEKMNDKKSFQYKGKTIYYFVKDIEWKEVRGKEIANAIMVLCDENGTQNDVFAIRDERYKVMYAMPDDAEVWYEKHINKKD